MSPLPTLALPGADGRTLRHTMSTPRTFTLPRGRLTARTVLAAPHTVVDARAAYTPGERPPVDWDATIAYRELLWRHGLGVAEAMDTSERGPWGLRWPQAQELIDRSLTAAATHDGLVLCGVGTDQLDDPRPSLGAVKEAYLEQLEFVQSRGGGAIIRASHALHRVARSTQDYLDVYDAILGAVTEPAVVHWLGEVFDPDLRGYWGTTDLDETARILTDIAERHASRLRGIKVSVLDKHVEVAFRRGLPDGVHVLTGDDHNYPELLAGDGTHHSDGLLGIFTSLAPIASTALQALEAGDATTFRAELDATLPLAATMFETPAASYKTGVVFLAWLGGHQDAFRMVSGREGARSLQHLSQLFVHFDRLGLFPDPDLAAHRMGLLLETSGVDQAVARAS